MKRLIALTLSALFLTVQAQAFQDRSSWGTGNVKVDQHSLDFDERSSDPGTPASNRILLYAKDSGGTTTLYTKDSAGTVSEVGAGGGGGTGDVSGVGNCTTGDCLDGTSDGGSTLSLYDGDSHKATFQTADLSADRTYTYQDVTGTIYLSGGTDVALADGGTGASLSDPGSDVLMFWDDSEGAVAFLTPDSSLTINGTEIGITAPIGLGDGGTGQTTRQSAIDALTDVANATTGYVLTKDGSGNATFQANTSSLFSDSSTTTYLTTTTDDFVIGASAVVDGAKLSVDGDADQVQFAIKAHGTQNEPIFEIKASDDSDLFVFGADGSITSTPSTTTATLSLGTAGVVISDDGDGAFTVLGAGNGSDESITVNLDDTANTAVINSATGVTKLDFGTIGLDANQYEINAGVADDTFAGLTITLTAGESVVIGDVCYMKSDGKAWKADADAIATSSALFVATGSIAGDASGLFGMQGLMRDDSGYNLTVGGLVYLSTTAGGITQTAPSGEDDVIQILGVAYSADVLLFKPSLVQVEFDA